MSAGGATSGGFGSFEETAKQAAEAKAAAEQAQREKVCKCRYIIYYIDTCVYVYAAIVRAPVW